MFPFETAGRDGVEGLRDLSPIVNSVAVLGPETLMTLTSFKKVSISSLTPAGTYQFQSRAWETGSYAGCLLGSRL